VNPSRRSPADVGLRHQVDAALVERVASGDAAHREPPAAAGAEALNRLIADDRAARRLTKGISVARPGRLTTMSSPGWSTRTGAIAARSRRRARFRLTEPVAPGTANATPATADSPGRARMRTAPERASLPDSRTAAIRRRPGRRCRGFISWEPESGACRPCDGVP